MIVIYIPQTSDWNCSGSGSIRRRRGSRKMIVEHHIQFYSRSILNPVGSSISKQVFIHSSTHLHCMSFQTLKPWSPNCRQMCACLNKHSFITNGIKPFLQRLVKMHSYHSSHLDLSQFSAQKISSPLFKKALEVTRKTFAICGRSHGLDEVCPIEAQRREERLLKMLNEHVSSLKVNSLF